MSTASVLLFACLQVVCVTVAIEPLPQTLRLNSSSEPTQPNMALPACHATCRSCSTPDTSLTYCRDTFGSTCYGEPKTGPYGNYQGMNRVHQVHSFLWVSNIVGPRYTETLSLSSMRCMQNNVPSGSIHIGLLRIQQKRSLLRLFQLLRGTV